MNIRHATTEEVSRWNDFVAKNHDGGNILQGKEFIEQKALAGWRPRYVLADDRAMAFMEKSVPLLGKIWYAPKGPSTSSSDDLLNLLKQLKSFAKKQKVFSIKIEPELAHDTDLSKLPLFKTKPVQYNYSTVLIDLSPSLDDIMKSFHQKGRHALRRAERDGVTVKAVEPTDENCAIMYELLKATGDGAGFPIRPADYYRTFYRRYGKNGQLFFAYFDSKVVAGAFAMVQGKKSMYKDGASVRERPAYGASHLLQWHVIQWAKSRGSLEHDLAGTPPINQINNPEHPLYGIGRFKTSFNKTVTEFVGAYNFSVRPLRGWIWNRGGEKLVRKLYFMRHGESWY